MQIGMIGLGRMGGNMVRRLTRDGHEVIGFDMKEEHVREVMSYGAEGTRSVEEMVGKLIPPRNVWVMVPQGGPTVETVEKLMELLEKDDLIIDGGNSRYSDSLELAGRCQERGLYFLDIGVSGGVWGLQAGYNLMVGGSEKAFQRLEPVLKSLAPENGYAYVGANGAGHFVKMIHNALEYAIVQAIGEAFECLTRSEFNLDLKRVAELWLHGSVVRSWLLELLVKAFEKEGTGLEGIADYVEDSGMGRWATAYAVENAIPIPVITQSLYERFSSRLEQRFSAKVIAALRNQFGGHAVKEG